MKKFLLISVLLASSLTFSAKKQATAQPTNNLNVQIDRLEKAEKEQTTRLEQRKIALDKEIEKLVADYNSRLYMAERLKMDSEVRWYRDEYKKISKDYLAAQDGLEAQINAKQAESAQIQEALDILKNY